MPGWRWRSAAGKTDEWYNSRMNPLESNRMLLAYALGIPVAAWILATMVFTTTSSLDWAVWATPFTLAAFAIWIWSEYGKVLERRLDWVGTSLADVARLGVPTIAASLALSYAVLALLPDQPSLSWILLPDALGPSTFTASLVYMVWLAPLIEEWLFRGFLLRGYARARGGVFALWAASAVFALLHPGVRPALYTFLMGWMLGRWVLAGGSLKAAFWVHLANNSLAALASPHAIFTDSAAAHVHLGPAAALALLAVALIIVVFFNRRYALPAERPEQPAPVFSLSLALVILLGVLAQAGVLFLGR